MKRLLALVLVPSLLQAISITFVNNTNDDLQILTENAPLLKGKDKFYGVAQQYGVDIGRGTTNILKSGKNRQTIQINLTPDHRNLTIAVIDRDGTTIKWSTRTKIGSYAGTWSIGWTENDRDPDTGYYSLQLLGW
ncbi:hypothetical protein M1466_02050 [Candidatus Dependentiae bacterium]|nr:hypothetical protein [Candidatus Dependentiae bacterium]